MGHTEIVVDRVAQILNASNIECMVHRAEVTDYSVIQQNDKFIFATSTWEHGVINPYFDKILSNLSNDNNLTRKYAAFIGLGSTKYEIYFFCEGAKILRKAWLDGGGMELIPPIYMDGLPYDKLDTIVPNWVDKLIQKLNETK